MSNKVTCRSINCLLKDRCSRFNTSFEGKKGLEVLIDQAGITCPYFETQEIQSDPVNHPAHYKTGKIGVLDYILDKFEGDYLLGNVCKYISRAKHKGKELEDLQKAEFYLKRKIKGIKNG